MRQFEYLLKSAEKPFLLLGGSRWNESAMKAVHQFAENWGLPVGCSFRRQHLFDHLHQNYAGDVGLGINPKLKQRIENSDLVILLGARFSENPSQGFSLFDIPNPKQRLVHVHVGAEELGRIYVPDLPIVATPENFVSAALELPVSKKFIDFENAHIDYLNWSDDLPETPGQAQMGPIVSTLRGCAKRHCCKWRWKLCNLGASFLAFSGVR
nr:hypothetical protein [Sneathiella glossodoripedis]